MKQSMQALIGRRLRKRRSELRRRLTALDSDMRRESEPLSADWAEQSTERANDEVLASVRLTCEAELRQVEDALRRLEEGTYGMCRECGEPIEPGRLYSVPHADLCSDCASPRGTGGSHPNPPGSMR
jgi:DnaK suppressor protein